MIFDNEPFVFIDPPKSLPGAGFILSTEPPFYIGRVIKMKPQDVDTFEPGEGRASICCNGYSVVILTEKSLIETAEPFSWQNLIKMADFYLNYRIIPNAGRYKRYKL